MSALLAFHVRIAHDCIYVAVQAQTYSNYRLIFFLLSSTNNISTTDKFNHYLSQCRFVHTNSMFLLFALWPWVMNLIFNQIEFFFLFRSFYKIWCKIILLDFTDCIIRNYVYILYYVSKWKRKTPVYRTNGFRPFCYPEYDHFINRSIYFRLTIKFGNLTNFLTNDLNFLCLINRNEFLFLNLIVA